MCTRTSTLQYRVQSLDDAILCPFVEIRMHRQAEYLAAQTIRYRQTIPGCRVIAISGLAVQPLCVIDGGGYACLFELGRRGISLTMVRNTHRVLRPHALKPHRDSRNVYEVLQALAVSSRHLIAGLDLVWRKSTASGSIPPLVSYRDGHSCRCAHCRTCRRPGRAPAGSSTPPRHRHRR